MTRLLPPTTSTRPWKKHTLPALAAAGLLIGCTLAAFAEEPRPAEAEQVSPPTIQVLHDEWNAPRGNVQALLESAARQIHRHFEQLEWPPIEVYRSRPQPITIHRRGAQGQVRIGLTPQGLYWAQYAFQFGHELGHLIAGHLKTDRRHENSWFEEAVCETASLYVLRAMYHDWEANPPYPNWKDWRGNLLDYARKRLDEPDHRLPDGQDFPAWYRENEEKLLEHTSHQGAPTVIVARHLLPVFESDPAGWQAVAYLRCGEVNPHGPLEALLPAWRDACPDALQGFVVRVGEALGIDLSAGESGEASDEAAGDE